MSKKRTSLIAFVVLAVLAAVAIIAYVSLKPSTTAGSKTITVHVDHLEGEDTDFTISTDEEYLRQALEQENLIAGSESQYGLWVETVDGETADDSAQQWWGYAVNGEFSDYGVDSQPVNDGDAYEFTLNVGW